MIMKNVDFRLLSTLKLMMKVRHLEEEIARLYHRGSMRCPTHLSIGQEAVPCALAPFIKVDDLVVSTHRGHAHYVAKGGSIPKMLAEIYGKSTGCSGGKGGSMHLIDKSVGFMGTSAIVGNSIPIGVGLAMGLKLEASERIAVVYLGDGATEEGVFYESLNFAIVRNLPVLFVCENNFYSVYSSLECRQPKNRKIFEVAEAMGMSSCALDGNDPLELIKNFGAVIDNIRRTSKPALVECATFRWREHCGPNFDDHLHYRDKSEVEAWKLKDPILKLIDELSLKTNEIDHIQREIEFEISASFEFAENSPYPSPDEAYVGEYAT